MTTTNDIHDLLYGSIMPYSVVNREVKTVCTPESPHFLGLAFAEALRVPKEWRGLCIIIPHGAELPIGAFAVFRHEDPKYAWARVVTELLPELWDIDEDECVYGSPDHEGVCAAVGTPGFGFAEYKGHRIRMPHCGRVVIGKDVEIGSNTCIDRGVIGDTVIGDGVKIDNLVHVAHNAQIGAGTLITAGAVIGGSAIIGERCFIGIGAVIRNKVRVGDGATVGMGAVVTKDVEAGATVVGNPARAI